ncbi:MAG: methyltransferase [Gammaproteobacteria bacterium]
MIRKSLALHRVSWSLLCAVWVFTGSSAAVADVYDAAVAHAGRSDADRKRDPLDHPAEILRLAGIKPGMHVADVLAGDGYYSELAGYVVGPQGRVLLINNAAFDHWSEPSLGARLKANRLPNVEHKTVNLDHLDLAPGSLDAVFLVKVYHDLYWVDPKGLESEGLWPKIDSGAVLDQLARALKPGGVLLLVDHSAKAGSGNTVASSLHRIEESYAVKDFESRGLKVVAKSDVLRRPDDARDQLSYKGSALGKTDRFVLVFRKSTG